MVTDSEGNRIALSDNYCDLEEGETYYFSAALIEGEGFSDSAEVQFRFNRMDEQELTSGEKASIAGDTVLIYRSEDAGRQMVTCSDDPDEVRLSVYDSDGDLIGVGGNTMIFEAEADTDYRITCTGAGSAILSADPYIADISVADITMTKELKYSKGLKVPAPEVYEDQVKLVRNVDYKLSYDGISAGGSTAPSRAKNVGKHKVTVTGIGKYKGSETVYYTVKPISTSLIKLKPYQKAVKVTWKKQSMKMADSRITGYQLQLATDKSFKKNKKTITVKGYKKNGIKVSKLKAKKTYHVRIRTYRTVNGQKYYSPWSKVKKTRIK